MITDLTTDAPSVALPSILLRGDPITGDRYWSREFMQREWDRMWTRVWHMGGRLIDLEQPGDYLVHDFLQESVIMVLQEDGRVRAFYNTCQHRGARLAFAEVGGGRGFTCPYHGWRYGVDGVLRHVQDPDDFPGGSPCGKISLVELPCDVWGGFVWYSMDRDAPALLDYLAPVPHLLRNRDMASMVRVVWRSVDVDTNWKFASDNFNESYHLPTVHPQLQLLVDEDYKNTIFEMHENGHNRMIERGQPSMRAPEPYTVSETWAEVLQHWDLDPTAFEGRPRDGRMALQRAKRRLGVPRGYRHFEKMSDDELTDYFHHTLFPNVTITGAPDGVHIFRTEPHLDDPNKCSFQYWYLVPPVDGVTEVPTVCGMRPMEEAEHERLNFGESLANGTNVLGSFVDQDLSIAVGQQRGLRSRGYRDAFLSGQESRVRRFHEVLNDYLEGRR